MATGKKNRMTNADIQKESQKVYLVDISKMSKILKEMEIIRKESLAFYESRGYFEPGSEALAASLRFKFINTKKPAIRPIGTLAKHHPLYKKGYTVYEVTSYPSDIFTDLIYSNDWLQSLKKLKEKAIEACEHGTPNNKKNKQLPCSKEEWDEKLSNLKTLISYITEGLKMLKGDKNPDIGELSNYFLTIGALTVLTGLHHYPDAVSGQESRRAGAKRSINAQLEKETRKNYVNRELAKIFSKNRHLTVNSAAIMLNDNWDNHPSLRKFERLSVRTISDYWKENLKIFGK